MNNQIENKADVIDFIANEQTERADTYAVALAYYENIYEWLTELTDQEIIDYAKEYDLNIKPYFVNEISKEAPDLEGFPSIKNHVC